MNDELYHYGVPGMRWGIRRTPSQLGHKPKAGKLSKKLKAMGEERAEKRAAKKAENIEKRATKKALKAEKKALTKTLKKQHNPDAVKKMTNEELKAAIDRINLENEYRRLNPKHVSAGEAFANTLIKDMLLPAATDAGKQLIKSGITKMINDSLELDDEYKLYTNNKKK